MCQKYFETFPLPKVKKHNVLQHSAVHVVVSSTLALCLVIYKRKDI